MARSIPDRSKRLGIQLDTVMIRTRTARMMASFFDRYCIPSLLRVGGRRRPCQGVYSGEEGGILGCYVRIDWWFIKMQTQRDALPQCKGVTRAVFVVVRILDADDILEVDEVGDCLIDL
jgi:hypothetical protein